MKTAGIDIGSRFIKYVLLEDRELKEFYKEETGYEPLKICNDFIEKTKPHTVTATGYGRYLLEVHGDIKTLTEIKAVAIGARHLFPGVRTIVDIGGQDTKVINLNEGGHVTAFEMNDRCAAGTGKFLEMMAHTLGYDYKDLAHEVIEETDIKINSMCAVFAESEVISLIAKGTSRGEIIGAVHNSIINKILPLINRLEVKDDIIFTGGCARNKYLKDLLEKRLKKNVILYENPDIIAAMGAALYSEK
jgi:predicted CoA-substrate-specific enzyme activase